MVEGKQKACRMLQDQQTLPTVPLYFLFQSSGGTSDKHRHPAEKISLTSLAVLKVRVVWLCLLKVGILPATKGVD
jgi:hypothetical protein